MKKPLFAVLLLACSGAFGQKKVECKKSTIEVDGKVVAEFDGKGGLLSSNRIVWLLSPATKDTLLIVHQSSTDINNPMVESDLVYKMYFYNTDKTTLYFKNPQGWGAVRESKMMSLFFNDKTPLVIEDGKLSESGIKAFKEQAAFDFEKILTYAKQVTDSLRYSSITVSRDKTKPVEFVAAAKTFLPKFYVSDEYTNYQVYQVKQGGVVIGALQKETTGGSFAKAKYTFYRAVTPFTVGDKLISFLPLAFSETSPGITSAMGKIDVTLYSTSKELKAADAPFNAAEYGIANFLIANQLL